MEDTLYLEEFENEESSGLFVNQKAEEIIQKCKIRKVEHKKILIKQMIEFINETCEKNDWEYFAVGKLLTYCIQKEDVNPDTYDYEIRMMRKAYDGFINYAQKHAIEKEIKIFPAYHEDARIREKNCVIGKKLVEDADLGHINTQVTISIIPYDNLPSDSEEREVFVNQVLEKNAWYNGLSGYVNRNIVKKQSLKTKLNLRFRYNRSYLENYRKKYKQFITKYLDMENPEYFGRLELAVTDCVHKKDVYPLRQEEFLGTTLIVPANTQEFSLPMTKEFEEKIADISCRALERFEQFCAKNNLTCFAVGNLLISCVKGEETEEEESAKEKPKCWRIGLLREDYEKAIRLLRNEQTAEGLVLKEYLDEYPNVKWVDVGILCKEDNKTDASGRTYPVYLDVFDRLPVDYGERCSYMQEVFEMRREYINLMKKQTGEAYPKRKKDACEQLEILDKAGKRYEDKKDSNLVFRSKVANSKIISLNEIFPIKKKMFHGIQLSVPNNEYLWYDKTDEGFTENTVNEKTKILKILDKICHSEGLTYFAISKLLIGAVVYHDVIPNSGNTSFDIGLIRSDFEKLIQYLREHDKEYGIVLNEFKDIACKYPEPTKYVTMKGNEYSIIRIKLLPFDKIPESFYLREYFRDKIKDMNQRYLELLDYKIGKTDKYLKMYTEEEWESRVKEYSRMDALSFAKEIDQFAQSYNDDDQAFSYERVAFRMSKIIDVDDIFPVQREKFRSIEIDCPRDYTPWQPVLNDELQYQVDCIQKADLKLLQEMDRVCKEIGVGYFICGGTMLGYMRHQGFIPWDDDVDVAMLRKDYDKFLKEAPKHLSAGVFLQTRETDPNIPYLFSKIRLDGTEYCTEYNINRDFHKGLCLDVFPFDYVPNDLDERNVFVKEVIALSKEHNAIARRQYPEIEEPFPPRNEQEKQHIEEQKALIQSYWKQSLKDSQRTYLEKATMYNDKAEELGLKTVASFVPSYTFIDLEDLLPYQRGIFEGIEVSVPKRPDIFLEMQYKNYMELPPLHMRVAHRLIRWSDGEHGADNQKKRDYSKIGGK
ncbi:MAG: LicD family protein [Lachnospiraceae bacterium]